MSMRTRAITLLLGGAMALASLGGCGPSKDSSDDATTSAKESAAETTDEATDALEMPDVVGKNAAVAKDELERIGFTKVTFGSVDPDNDTIGVVNPANWTVEEQSHDEGASVPADATIVLGCVKN